ncbi:MAG: nitrous oxide reductase accessory protein NosL, partial [Sulfurimonas sp.]|nr:nitrous oxide reductase accessory protein NosL [Sulfurimonas sp.]
IAMIKKKKEKKIYPMGKKIFTKMCNQDIDPNDYIEINELKSAIKNEKLCRPLKEKQLQALSLYLWEVKRFGDLGKIEGTVKVEKHEKCPVCGMFTYKYPRWAAQIFYKHDNHEHHYSFDGVKDMMKFYFDPMAWGNYKTSTRENIINMLVTDYYSQKAIDARTAYYVIGSDIYGPMGNELIPFESEADAKSFYMDHRGTKIIQFDNIKEKEVYKLDE